MTSRTSVVVITRNRRDELVAALDRITDLSPEAPVIVVDNSSEDRTAEAVRARMPQARVIALERNAGAAGRNIGVAAAATPYVAFSDDDSWWAPGALSRAAHLLEGHPRLALVAARVLVGPEQQEDPACRQMRCSPLCGEPDLPGRPVLGFIACGAVVRRDAFLAVGGFEERLGVGGEEDLLALDLAVAGWGLAYCEDVVAHHHPSPNRDPAARRRRLARNNLWTAWLRRPATAAAARTLRELTRGGWSSRAGAVDAVRAGRWVLDQRRVLPGPVEQRVRTLERAAADAGRNTGKRAPARARP